MVKRSLHVRAVVPAVVVGVAATCLAGCSGSDSAQVSSSSKGAGTGSSGDNSASVGVFTYSAVAAGQSKHYVVTPGGGDKPQGGDPLKDSPSEGGAAESSPVMTDAKPVKTPAERMKTTEDSGSEGAVSQKISLSGV